MTPSRTRARQRSRIEIIPEAYRIIVQLNPMTYFVEAFRAPIYSGTLPSNPALLRAGLSAFVALAGGILVFERYSDRIAYHV